MQASIHPEKGVFEFSLSARDNLVDDSRCCGDRVSSCQKLKANSGNDVCNSCGVLCPSCNTVRSKQCNDEKPKADLVKKNTKADPPDDDDNDDEWKLPKRDYQQQVRKMTTRRHKPASLAATIATTKKPSTLSKKILLLDHVKGNDFLSQLMNVETDSEDERLTTTI